VSASHTEMSNLCRQERLDLVRRGLQQVILEGNIPVPHWRGY
jgi:hypothetical protein